jgi:hypothetical protein
LAELEGAVRAEQQAATALRVEESAAHKRMAVATKAASEAELASMNRRIHRIADQVLEQIRFEATNKAPSAWKAKVCVGMTISLLAVASAGVIIGSIWNDATFFITKEESKQLAFGKKMEKILPQLDKRTLNKIVEVSENSK